FRGAQAKAATPGEANGREVVIRVHPDLARYFEGDGQEGLERLGKTLERKITIQPNFAEREGYEVRLRGGPPQSAADGQAARLPNQSGEAGGRAQARRQARRPHGAVTGARPDAHPGAFAPLLGEVSVAPVQSARSSRRPARDQAGRPHRLSEGMEAAAPAARE